VAAILPAIVYTLVGLTLALCLGNATAAVTLMTTLMACVLLALWDGLVAAVGYVTLLLLGPGVVISRRHQVFSC
jgi:hypothetical protein